MSSPLLTLILRHEQDVVTARQRAGRIAALVGFDPTEQTRIATAVSEIVRNAYRYAGSGTVEFRLDGETAPQLFVVRVSDRGPGIPNLPEILAGQYQSTTGMGMGLMGARRLMDRCEIESGPRGTTVVLTKLLPRRARLLSAASRAEIARTIADGKPTSLVEEIQRQNQELLRALDELARKQEDLTELNRELEDTNRGVVALYAELDEKADHLRRADELKSRFLSNMTHEFRTPVNAILALAALLADRADPPPEVGYIRRAAEQLSEIVNDLLDLAKVEAGKTVVRVSEFEVTNLFGALRGMLRPLLVNQSVVLTFEESAGVPPLHTDEGKVSQILRNFISNALKFTERGEILVRARLVPEREEVHFSVSDTGIGIAPEDQTRIFEEFAQVEHALQGRVKGTGLGLPLSKRLAELLGGRLSVESTPGIGSTFTAAIPIRYRSGRPETALPAWTADPARLPVLIIEDGFDSQLVYERILKGSVFQVLPARNLAEAAMRLEQVRPAAIVLDILLEDGDAWELLASLKRRPDTQEIPVIVVSTVDDSRKGLALGADAYAVKPIDRDWLLGKLNAMALGASKMPRVLVIDDQEAMRYVVRQLLGIGHVVIEAATGTEGLERARADRPDVVLVDLGLPDVPGEEVVRRLRLDPLTGQVPIVVVTSRPAQDPVFDALRGAGATVVFKDALSRDALGQAIATAERQVRLEGSAHG